VKNTIETACEVRFAAKHIILVALRKNKYLRPFFLRNTHTNFLYS